MSGMSPNTMPTFFTEEVLSLFHSDVKMLLIWAGPLIMIVVALFIAYGFSDVIVGLFVKKPGKKKDDDDDYEIYRY